MITDSRRTSNLQTLKIRMFFLTFVFLSQLLTTGFRSRIGLCSSVVFVLKSKEVIL